MLSITVTTVNTVDMRTKTKTIPCSPEVKRSVERFIRSRETWDDALKRLVNIAERAEEATAKERLKEAPT